MTVPHATIRYFVTPHVGKNGVTLRGWDVRRVNVDEQNREYDGGMVYGGTSLTKKEAKRLASEHMKRRHAS